MLWFINRLIGQLTWKRLRYGISRVKNVMMSLLWKRSKILRLIANRDIMWKTSLHDSLIAGNISLVKEYLHLYKNIKFPTLKKKIEIMLQEYKIASLKNRKMSVTCRNKHLWVIVKYILAWAIFYFNISYYFLLFYYPYSHRVCCDNLRK